jgi:retinol dehydrogenase-12
VAPVTVYLVTGATGGIGFATAQALARRPDATVLVHGRSAERTAAVAAQLGGEPFVADLSSLDEVRRLAGDVLTRYERIDVLVNNAGVIFAPPETVFTVNHLAPFLLTNLLGEHVTGRVVTVSSTVHAQVKTIDWDNLGTYAATKLCNILFTRELARRRPGVSVNAAHPGFVNTGLGRGASGSWKAFLALARPFMTSAAKGARTPIYVAGDPAVAGVTGQFFAKCKPVEPSPLARDDAAAAKLWALSERLTGVPS